MDDPHNFRRYLEAQTPVYARVLAELSAGSKQSHWMWFIFPQLRGLGSSATAQHYALGSLEEACAYLAHPVLGSRLRECAQLVNRLEGRSAQAIFGYPDWLKFRSSMTLFAHAAASRASAHSEGAFDAALAKYFAGEGDALTRELLA